MKIIATSSHVIFIANSVGNKLNPIFCYASAVGIVLARMFEFGTGSIRLPYGRLGILDSEVLKNYSLH